MFWTRLISGVVLVALALLLIIPGEPVLLVSTCVISLIGLFEYYRALGLHKKPAAWVGYIFTVLYYISFLLQKEAAFSMNEKLGGQAIWWKGSSIIMLIVCLLIALLFFYVFAYPKYDIKQIAGLFFGPMYVSVMLIHLQAEGVYSWQVLSLAYLPYGLGLRYLCLLRRQAFWKASYDTAPVA